MKRVLFVCMLFAALFVSCSSGPDKAAQSFTENMAKGKFEQAKKYATEPTGMLLDMAANFGGANETNDNFKFEHVSTDVDGDTATVTYKDKNDPEAGEQTVDLIKVNGQWKVNVDMQK